MTNIITQADKEYIRVVNEVLKNGSNIQTRNSKCRKVFGIKCEFTEDPIVTVRKTAWKSAVREWEWFMSGSSNINDLHPSVHKWWEPWANPDGEIPNNYSKQLRDFTGDFEFGHGNNTDQIDFLVQANTNHPYSRRNVITTWNTHDMLSPSTPITNCHGTVIQTSVNADNTLDLIMYQRSADFLLGVQHNWIQYRAFQKWLAQKSGRDVGKLVWMAGDVHIYDDHMSVANKISTVQYRDSVTAEYNLLIKDGVGEFAADDFSFDREIDKPIVTDKVTMVV